MIPQQYDFSYLNPFDADDIPRLTDEEILKALREFRLSKENIEELDKRLYEKFERLNNVRRKS